MSSSYKKLLTNAYKNRNKVGKLTKMFDKSKPRSDKLVNILKDSSILNTIAYTNTPCPPTSDGQSNDEFLKSFQSMKLGGSIHPISKQRTHHLNNYLSNFIINIFQSGQIMNSSMTDHDYTSSCNDGDADLKSIPEISRVELRSNLQTLSIHWLCSSDETIVIFNFFDCC
jgi:hypothetical protein